MSPWWSELNEERINDLGYHHLRSKDPVDWAYATDLFAINTEAHPQSWNAWDSYAEALARLGRHEEAARAYARALEAYPTNWNSSEQQRFIDRVAAAKKGVGVDR